MFVNYMLFVPASQVLDSFLIGALVLKMMVHARLLREILWTCCAPSSGCWCQAQEKCWACRHSRYFNAFIDFTLIPPRMSEDRNEWKRKCTDCMAGHNKALDLLKWELVVFPYLLGSWMSWICLSRRFLLFFHWQSQSLSLSYRVILYCIYGLFMPIAFLVITFNYIYRMDCGNDIFLEYVLFDYVIFDICSCTFALYIMPKQLLNDIFLIL